MYQPNDDFLGHQTPAPLSQPAVADTDFAMFTERYWYTGSVVPAGRIVFSLGLGYYPNRGVMDGFAGVTIDGVQISYRASRHTGQNPLQTEVGALRLTVRGGLQSHRLQLLENDSGVTMDLEFEATMTPNDEGRDVLQKNGKILADVTRFVQFGNFSGWIAVNGQRIAVNATECPGARDRSWGLRMEARTDPTHPPVTRMPPMFFAWLCAQFKTHGIHFFMKEDAPGRPRFFAGNETYSPGSGKPPRKIIALEHEIEWFDDQHSQHVKSGVIKLDFEDGSRTALKLRALPGRFYLKAGMYGGLQGWFQGDDKGAFYSEHSAWNHADHEIRKKLGTLADQIMEYECEGEIGYGTFQAGVSKGYDKYQHIQEQPMM